MGVEFAVRLLERQSDRVIVSVILDPGATSVPVDGVGVELFSRGRDSLSPRVLLPISGTLSQAMAVQVELRAHGALPVGAFIQGQLWQSGEATCVLCPADPSTELEAHVRGRHPVAAVRSGPSSAFDDDLEGLLPEERERLARVFPWIELPRCAAGAACLDANDDLDELSDELGLDAEEAALLREILES